MAAATASTFWTRMRISETERLGALKAVRSRYPDYTVREHEEQGLCSYTLLLTPVHASSSPLLCSREQRTNSPCSLLSRRRRDAISVLGQLVVQLRGPAHLLDLDLAEAAWKLYHPLAPQIRLVDKIPLPGTLVTYEMNRVEGTPLSRVLQRRWDAVRGGQWEASMKEEEKMIVLVRSFAQMLAKSWPEKAGPRQRRDSVIQPHPPPHKNTDMLSLCTGKVGSQITRKLSQLAQQLPDERLRAKAQSTLDQIRQVVGDWPVVLTHGDLISSNLLVDEESWAVCGLVDWAEAEYLPFGTCLYGLEEMLGCLENPVPVSVPQPESESEAEVEEQARDVGKMWRFVYADGADRYRTLFLRRVLELVPQIRGRVQVLWAMRDLGVLLWHGFAWDGGKIDRVVNEVDDGEELAKLRAMLAVRLDIWDDGNGDGRERICLEPTLCSCRCSV